MGLGLTYAFYVIRRLLLLACGAFGLGLGFTACTSTPNQGTESTVAAPGCHGSSPAVHLALSNQQPIPIVHLPRGGCVEVTVPKSPFDGVRTEAPRVTPSGRLQLVSDALNQDGTRTAYYSAHASATATISSTVMIQSDLAVPEWVGVVIVT